MGTQTDGDRIVTLIIIRYSPYKGSNNNTVGFGNVRANEVPALSSLCYYHTVLFLDARRALAVKRIF